MSEYSNAQEWEEIETISLDSEIKGRNNGELAETSFVENELSPSSSIRNVLSPTNFSKNKEFGVNSRRPSTDAASLDGKSTTSGEGKSYRDKLRDRINIVKERASVGVIAAQRSARLIQRNSKQDLISRITDTLFKEEEELKNVLEKRKRAKEEAKKPESPESWSRHSEQTEDVDYGTGLEFFTKNWETPEEEIGSTESVLTRDTEFGGDDAKIMARDYLGLRDVLSPAPTEFKEPILCDEERFKAKESEILFVPSTESVLVGKRESERNANEMRNDGLFVEKHSKMRVKNYNKMCQRLVRSATTMDWFGEDGKFSRVPDPKEVLVYNINPYTNDICDASSILRYKSAILFGEKSEESAAGRAGNQECFVLELFIGRLHFSHHPLFSPEHVLSAKICQLFAKYQQRLEAKYTKRLLSKLDALRKTRDNLTKILEQESEDEAINESYRERIVEYKSEIRETREEMMISAKNDTALLAQLLLSWKRLKYLRVNQKFISTTTKLQIVQSEKFQVSQIWEEELQKQKCEILEELQSDKNEHEIDEDMVENNLREKFLECALYPGEPSVRVSIIEQPITPDNELAYPAELHRRNLASRSGGVWFSVLYNNHEVCKSLPYPLDGKFGCDFSQKYAIRIRECPEKLSLLIYRDKAVTKGIFQNQLAEIFVPIPSSGCAFQAAPLEEYEFSSLEKVPGGGCRHAGVGAGVEVQIGEEKGIRHTSAVIACRAGWSTHEGRTLSPPQEFFKNRSKKTRFGNMPSDLSKLKEWIKFQHLDPNDPNNAYVFELLKKADRKMQEEGNFLSVGAQSFDFCSEEDILQNARLRLLTLRDKGELEFKNVKAVPLREREIPRDIFKTYEKRISSPDLPFDTFGLGQLEIHRAWGRHSLTMLYDRILKKCQQSQQHRNTKDMVHEEKVPDIGTLGLTFMKLLQPKRPLRPKRKGRKKIPVKGLSGQEVKLIVNVVRAFEIPIRKDVDTLAGDTISLVPVRPFVEVTFRNQTKRTVTADGPNPTWNQDLQFSLLGPNMGGGSFQMSSMQSLGDSLHLHLFDEIVVDILEDDRVRDRTIHQRLERNWLGSLRIPFSTLYFNHQVEGTFQLYSPPFLLGYVRQQTSASHTDNSHLRNSTFITLFIIVQPPLCPPDTITENLECSEEPTLEQHLEAWKKDVAKQVPHRAFKTFVTDASGKTACVTRFFRAISPPTIYENEVLTPEMIARYVSLIPVSSSGALIFGHFDVWLTCEEMIRLLSGGREDHAILLCCFFTHVGLKAWLLLGRGIPHGESAYVLTRHDSPMSASVYNIWDPVSGLKYSSKDSFSPLHKVYCLINDENIWVNVQAEELIRRTNFDVTEGSDWRAAFARPHPKVGECLQPASIEYGVTSITDVHLLQDKIEKCLRDAIMKWRPTSKTVWNRYCIATLRKLLPILESEACEVRPAASGDKFVELQHLLGSYKICGFPISQPFTNLEAVVEAVKATGVHQNENPNVEFALAVYIHPYASDVLSVWVYTASLAARR